MKFNEEFREQKKNGVKFSQLKRFMIRHTNKLDLAFGKKPYMPKNRKCQAYYKWRKLNADHESPSYKNGKSASFLLPRFLSFWKLEIVEFIIVSHRRMKFAAFFLLCVIVSRKLFFTCLHWSIIIVLPVQTHIEVAIPHSLHCFIDEQWAFFSASFVLNRARFSGID